MDCIKKGFGNNLKDLRRLKNLTQEKLSELVGINLRQLARIEAGESFVTSETLYNICSVLKVNPSVLFDFEMEEEILKTGTGSRVHFSAIKSGNLIKLINEDTASTEENEQDNVKNDIDIKMQITAKKLNKEIVVDEIVGGKVVNTKIYFPNGDINIENKSVSNSNFEELRENILKIKNDDRKIKFLNLALEALTNKNSLLELKALLKGIELMYDDKK